jgi:hypothetical protein
LRDARDVPGVAGVRDDVPWWGTVSSAAAPVLLVTGLSVTVTLAALTVWFAAEQATHGGHMGLAERTAGLAQALWPLIAVMSCRLSRAAPELTDDLLEPEH